MKKIIIAWMLTTVTGGIFILIPSGTMKIPVLLSATFFIIAAALFFWTLATEYRKKGRRARTVRSLFTCSICSCIIVVFLIHYKRLENPLLTLLQNSNLLCITSCSGIFLAKGLRRPSEIIPACIVAILADICSMHSGPTGKIAEEITIYYASLASQHQVVRPFADSFLLKIFPSGSAYAIPLFGMTDWFFVAFFWAALIHLELPSGPGIPESLHRLKTDIRLPLAPTALLLALSSAHLTGTFLPGLVFIGGVVLGWVLLADRRCRQMNRKEWLMTCVFAVLLPVGMAIFHCF